ncbi:Cro/CI family transcriptional regulator [Arsenophonus nasoniae]|nr:Cro/CI family transcriptional regulator [Arsenophonus nasoniae]QBY41939.1 Putative antitoxin of bacterial toxin-antitoxin system, YdaS/YdaT [Arsenophonus nasoniae]WGM06144.1 Cro/CI family transcriptional regulator [Arsenophonus nasoniae]WGM11106.1 Cro/CI family transcriptional regulator [Arsenophonus nasoniae]WGM15807.1 Cro/CI family transcriptional regulator [Arsenophonus nasoniae]
MEALKATIEKAGGVPALAKLLNISDQAIRQWTYKGYIPPSRYAQINKLLDIPLEDLVKNKEE